MNLYIWGTNHHELTVLLLLKREIPYFTRTVIFIVHQRFTRQHRFCCQCEFKIIMLVTVVLVIRLYYTKIIFSLYLYNFHSTEYLIVDLDERLITLLFYYMSKFMVYCRSLYITNVRQKCQRHQVTLNRLVGGPLLVMR